MTKTKKRQTNDGRVEKKTLETNHGQDFLQNFRQLGRGKLCDVGKLSTVEPEQATRAPRLAVQTTQLPPQVAVRFVPGRTRTRTYIPSVATRSGRTRRSVLAPPESKSPKFETRFRFSTMIDQHAYVFENRIYFKRHHHAEERKR